MRFAPLALALLVPLVSVSCASDTDDPGDDVEDTDATADGAAFPVGAFEAVGERGDYSILLAVQGTKRIVRADLEDGEAPFAGKFKYTKSRGKRYIRMVTEDGELYARYQYDVTESGVLKLRKAGTETWYPFRAKDEGGWCGPTIEGVAEAEVCSMQNLITPRCIGEWTCADSACGFDCRNGG